MADRYLSFATSRVGGRVAARLGLPRPARLGRYRPGQPVARGPVVLGHAADPRAVKPLQAVLDRCGATVQEHPGRPGALLLDATGITAIGQLAAVHAFFHPRIRSLLPNGRVLVLGTPPESAATPGAAAAQQALEGFVRSLGKELRHGATAHLLLIAPGAEEAMESTVRFVLSARSAYVSGQPLRLAAEGPAEVPADWNRPLAGRTALVTGAARGIGAAVAETLHRDGARVLCLDVPGQRDALHALADRLGGTALALDVTADDAVPRIAAHLGEEHGGGLDVLVHNAGITRDKTLGRMDADRWHTVLDVNLAAVERLTEGLLPAVRDGGRIVATSSISGLAGNAGQTNYAASKAGVTGLVRAFAPAVAARGITVNAVAPGFIETRMTAAVPPLVRQAGRRLNSLGQGGLPVDVAEAVAYFASPGTGAVTGQVLRVCGQALMGA
ncbi:3-oxoacyl-ACP reductase [Streptomyces sp. MP131-18]|uniref:3-oxoacyl-ACP reductase n=1 Tax=Streptomyces sp. MP131-18 TaxID=1857892 RepID=UPI00097C1F26|nr:3-oxoacyl-ACP reductase [Streptomyces sp. MP131-18]ONK10242.1 3-oxoacyl-[acyl-carrier-protein] reductase FabG [Streptomyces sp. MP131-18]